MENLAADFIIDFNNPIEAEYELSEGGFDCSFELFAAGTVWGSIDGELSNQTDLQDALDLKADKTDLDADVEIINQTINENYNTLDNKIDTVNSELNTAIQNEATTRAENDTLLQNNINTLSQTVTANYNTLDGKIDTEISNRTASDTTLQNNIDAEVLARQNADTTLQGNIDTLSDTVSDNYTDLDGKISDLTDTVNDNDTAINNKVDGINTTLTNSINTLSNTVSSNYTALDTKIDNTKNALDNDISDLSDTVTSNYNSLDARITTNTGNIATNAGNITTINSKIPNQASSSNQLADKSFVNSSIATNTANFIGTFNSVAELEAYTGTLTNNDYAFVATTDAVGNTLYDRYKWNGSEWLFEYELNNSSFTAQQWASINSGATNTNIGQITINANNIADLQTNKQDVLTAGANVQINNNVISATDTTYTAGTGISIINGVISNTQTSAEWGNIQGTLSNQTDLQNALDAKQNTISDLSTIRSGASAGATALQPNDNITELVNNAGYITASALTGYATETWVGNQGYITGITSSDVTTALGYTPLSNATKYGSSLSYSSNVLQLLDQDGNSLGNSVTIQSSPNIDNKSITTNSSDDLQTVGVIDQNNTSNAIKTWTGTKAQYDAIVTKNSTTLYFLTDVGKIYFGDTLISNVGNNTLLDFKWADHQLNDIQWLRADTFSWQSGDVYVTAYNHLVADIDGITAETETIGSYTVTFYRATDGHKICLADQEQTVLNIYNTYGIAWYYILDTTNTQFKLPRTKYGFEGLRTNVGDNIDESLPNHTHSGTTNTTGAHTHSRGTMNITGTWAPAGLDTSYNVTPTGAFSNSTRASDNYLGHGSKSGNTPYVNFNAANGWSGATTSNGDHSHTMTTGGASSSTYQDNAPVQERATQMYLYFYVGDYSQTAIEQTAGLNAELFNGKADTTLSNVPATITQIPPTSLLNFDGQWVYVNATVSQATAIGNYTIDLSSYLPNDNYAYECMFAWDITTVANGLTGTAIGSTNAYSYNGIINGGFTNHILTGKTVEFAIWNSNLQSCTVRLIRYRRLGTNQ